MSVAMHVDWLARLSCLWDGLENWTSHHVTESQIPRSLQCLNIIRGAFREGTRGQSSPLLYILGGGRAKGNPYYIYYSLYYYCYTLTLKILSSLTSFAFARFAPLPPFLETLTPL